MTNHYESCHFALVPCKAIECDVEVPRHELLEHEKNCPWLKISQIQTEEISLRLELSTFKRELHKTRKENESLTSILRDHAKKEKALHKKRNPSRSIEMNSTTKQLQMGLEFFDDLSSQKEEEAKQAMTFMTSTGLGLNGNNTKSKTVK